MFTVSILDKVTQHPYRTARVIPLLQIDRNSDEGYALEKKLAKMAGVETDNHVVYTVNHYGKELHFMCSDMHISVGPEIIVENW